MGLSISQAAAQSGLSKGFISLVENGKSDITVGRLSRLLAIYHTDIPVLMDSPRSLQGEQGSYRSSSESVTYTSLGSDPSKTLSAVKVVVDAGGGWASTSAHDGAEFIYVLEGEIVVVVEGSRTTLGAGEGTHFSSGQDHELQNEGEHSAVVLAVMTHL